MPRVDAKHFVNREGCLQPRKQILQHAYMYTLLPPSLTPNAAGILTPYEGEVRLVGGAYASEGVVQINLHHTWSTVCSTDVEPGLATSMCRQLGYTRALRYTHTVPHPVWAVGFKSP